MPICNLEIREAIRKRRLKHWEVADALGYNASYFSRLLRHELPDERKREILEVIDSIEI